MIVERGSADVHHLCARVGLLLAVGQRHRIEPADRVVADEQIAAFQVIAEPVSTCVHEILSAPMHDPRLHEVVDATVFFIAWIPVRNRRRLGVLMSHQLDHRRMQPELVALRRRAPRGSRRSRSSAMIKVRPNRPRSAR